MSYKIDEFDGLSLSEFIQRGDRQLMGSGFGETRLEPLPGGGFFDHHGDEDIPPAIDPIIKSGYLENSAGVQSTIQTLRGKLRKKGVLKIVFHDNTTWRQNARLTRVELPRTFESNLSFIPFRLVFTPLDGYWESDTQTTTTQAMSTGSVQEEWTVSADTGATRNISNFTIRYQNENNTTTGLTIRNRDAGQTLEFSSLVVAANQEVRWDLGAKTVRFYYDDTDIDAIVRSEDGTKLNIQSTGHGLSTGHHVYVEGTSDFDGHYESIDVTDANNITATFPSTSLQPTDESDAAGTVRRYTDVYSSMDTITSPRDWMLLKAGNNLFRLEKSSDVGGDIVTIVFRDAYK